MKDNSDTDSASECDSCSNNMSPFENVKENVEYPTKGETLVIMRILNVQVKQEDSN